ncbi:hypothetical protein K1T71_008812 [Dendrolimus kikuchii]|uniref:Uncharacterized protein n=1 Tax=Dendrolimus kikuchii TaxID=765133 RepID=A0ACC1CVH7_9NEOP|nr:hypothetical protein K1T71_008812 [Dendrolimus kikuchii]
MGLALCLVSCRIDFDENNHDPVYGEDWLMYVDDNGSTHMMNFSYIPSDTRGILLGGADFYLYTRRNEVGEYLNMSENKELIKSNYFNSSNTIKVLTHGWFSDEQTEWIQLMKDDLLRNGDFNVITVDWQCLAKNIFYQWSALSTRYVGKLTAKLLNALSKSYNIRNDTIHLIGHSLGAHVMGYAGMFAKNGVHRITGLDPARPLFEIPSMPPEYRLEKSDADFVDIIHTSSGLLGYKRSHGHADFYPNSGKPIQPGCDVGIQYLIDACSHARSHKFFSESIDPKNRYTSYPCESWDEFVKNNCRENSTLMGFYASDERYGDFYLQTRGHPPYAIDQEESTL